MSLRINNGRVSLQPGPSEHTEGNDRSEEEKPEMSQGSETERGTASSMGSWHQEEPEQDLVKQTWKGFIVVRVTVN